MKTSFDLPEPLLRRAKVAAAQQGRPLRDLVAEAIADKLAAPASAAPVRRTEPPASDWEAFLATLELQPDGSYLNPKGADDAFFEALDSIRAGRLAGQAALFPAPGPAVTRKRKRA